jgi:hypothetical protein
LARTQRQAPRQALKEISEAENRAEAAIILGALDEYLVRHKPQHKLPFASDVFGLWKHRRIKGREYQDLLRSEW